MASEQKLSRRERQLMDAIFQSGEATAAEVHAGLSDPPTLTAVRTLLRILEEKGFIGHREDGRRFVYRPLRSPRSEGVSAFKRVLRVFFGGSLEQALSAHFGDPRTRLDDDELQRMRALIEETGTKGTSSKPRKGKKP